MISEIGEERTRMHDYGGGEEAAAVGTRFHLFDEIEESDINIIHLQSPRKALVEKESLFFLYYLDLTFGQLDFFILWRFISIAYNMSIRWSTGSIYVLNFMVPFFISLLTVAWPTYLFEFGISVATGRENVGAMASLGRRSRVAGLNWLISLMLLLCTVPLASYAGIYSWEASEHWATFSSPGYKAQDALDLYVGRECSRYQDYVPHISPLLCGPRGKRLDISCYDEDQCHLWSGNGRCLAVPWAPASEYLLTSADEYDPMLDQDYPQYCAARALHDVTTNHATAVINHAGLKRDWQGTLTARLPLAFSIVMICAAAMATLSAVGVQGNRAGSACRIAAQILRSSIGVFGFICTAALLIYALTWWHAGHVFIRDATRQPSNLPSNEDWNKGLTTFSIEDFFHPDIWAYSMIQALLTLRVGTGQNELVGARLPDRSHMMLASLSHLILQTVMCLMLFASCWLAYGMTALKIDMGTEPERGFSVIRFDLRNNPYGTVFTSLQTMFDNSPKLNGEINDRGNFGTIFWLAMALLGINGVSHALDVIAGALSLSSWNWRGGRLMNNRRGQRRWPASRNQCARFCDSAIAHTSAALAWLVGGSPRWVWTVLIAVLTWAVTSQEWFGSSWGMTITYHHFTTHLLYPFTILYHTMAMAWMVVHDWRVKNFGKVFTFVQLVALRVGGAIAGFSVTATWRTSPVYSPLIGAAVGLILMALSFGLPLAFLRSHDVYGRRHSRHDALKMIFFGSANHVRNELNLRCCHTNRLLRISTFSTLGVRYVVPTGMLLAIGNIFTSGSRLLWHFSPYVPFDQRLLSDQFLVMQSLMERHDLIRAPVWLIALAVLGPILLIVIPPLYFVWPAGLDWLVPYDVDDNFFQVQEAIEKFADETQVLTQAPLDAMPPPTAPDAASQLPAESEYNTVIQ